MNQQDFKKLVDKTVQDTAAILISKGEEYAGSADRLANFKRGAQLTGVTPLQCCFIYMSKHYDSLSTYVRKDSQGFKQILSEPIDGRLDDLINYCMLMKALIQEAHYTSNPTPVQDTRTVGEQIREYAQTQLQKGMATDTPKQDPRYI